MSKLTDKQEMFCKEYLIDLNATQAAIRAGYSENTANRTGSKLLSKADIQELIQRLKTERNERLEFDADWVLKEAVKSYKFNAQSVHDNDGNPKMVNATAAGKFLELAGKHNQVKAFDSDAAGDKGEAQPLNITFQVKEPSAEIEVTRGNGD